MNTLAELQQRFQSFWQARAPRERRALLLMTIVVLLAMAVQILWSAHRARERLHREVPALRAELAAMQAQALEWRRLRAQGEPMPMLSDAALDAAVRASLAGLNGSGSALTSRLIGSRQIALQGQVDFDRWVDWLAQMQSSQQLTLVRCEVRAKGQPGHVQIDGELAGAE